MLAKNRVGQKFGRLIILSVFRGFSKNGKYGLTWANVKCSCGVEKVVDLQSVTRNGSKSCGCQNVESARMQGFKNAKHGHARKLQKVHDTYTVRVGMLERCYNEKNKAFKNYGGRGIYVCNEWKDSYENFLQDMGERPKNTTLDRIDNEGNYTKDNCRWATIKEQANNRRTNLVYTLEGIQKTLKEWCEEYNISYKMVWKRVKAGRPLLEALTTMSKQSTKT
jgi:hypothetical protein